ncbi:MAG: hypothetical protein IKX66_02295, partial [Clostridia bacterium]|nr:hypothetical protein [Clostridia bacterium]
VPLPDGNYHCFNAVGGRVFDLTSEQFLAPLDYRNCLEQLRETHLGKTEKRLRYEELKDKLAAILPPEKREDNEMEEQIVTVKIKTKGEK